MPQLIQVLPERIANQIAAGEVIQRPASAVKELLENAVDSGADRIELILRDAGKALVQVIDNGRGMSPEDALLSVARHATSKIQTIDDLFRIRTMGFRGEALASMAAVARLEIRTRSAGQELGTLVEVENSRIINQEACSTPEGSNISLKNLFFNVPARRNFLKSNSWELRQILEEFTRVAMAFPDRFFSLVHNGQTQFHLEKGNHKQRILQLIGSAYSGKLVTVKEQIDLLGIHGFIGKPEASKKTRGEQYFFVNGRFIRSPYLHHALMNAYSELISPDSFPPYFLFLDLDPSQLDINVHPTKQEIKFGDEKLVYAFVQSCVRHALASNSIGTGLEFDLPQEVQQWSAITQPFTEEKQRATQNAELYQSFTKKNQAHLITPSQGGGDWKKLYEIALKPLAAESGTTGQQQESKFGESQEPWMVSTLNDQDRRTPVQVHRAFILQQIKSGFILIEQQAAHEKTLYESYLQVFREKPVPVQQSLFPQTLELSPGDALLMGEMALDLKPLGYEILSFGPHTFVVQGVPPDFAPGQEKQILEQLLEQYKNFSSNLKIGPRERLIRVLAHQRAVPAGQALQEKEMQHLIDQLFACPNPQIAPSGRKTFLVFRLEDLYRLFA